MRKYFSAILVLMLLVATAGCYDDEFKSDLPSDDMSYEQLQADSAVSEVEIDSAAEVMYIGNVKTFKIHTMSCHTLPLEENRVYFESVEEGIGLGYEPCFNCLPE